VNLFDIIKNRFSFQKQTDAPVADIETVAKKFVAVGSFSDENQRWKDSKMTPGDRRKLALSVPLFWKGVQKKSFDIFRSWIFFDPVGDREKPSLIDMKIINNFERRTNILQKMALGFINAYVYGDGFILISFLGESKEQDLSIPPEDNAEPIQLTLLDSEHINEMVVLESNKKSRLKHFHYFHIEESMDFLIHPDRLIHLKTDFLPFSNFGISKVDIARKILNSMVEVDIAVGDLLKWFAHGFLHWSKSPLSSNEKNEMMKVLEQHPYAIVDDKNEYDLKVHNPTAIQPKEFFDWLVLKIAAVLVMPTHILTGVQIGKTTGAEVGYSDYRKDIQDIQDIIISPHLYRLYTMLFEANDRKFNYHIKWVETYVDEMSEANIMFKRASIVERLWKTGTADRPERRKIMNDGYVVLEPDAIPDMIVPPPSVKQETDKEEKPEKDEKTKKITNSAFSEHLKTIPKLFESISTEQQDMIYATKELAEHERLLGIEELEKQDTRMKEAKNAYAKRMNAFIEENK